LKVLPVFRVFQVAFILFGIVVVSFALGLTSEDPEVRSLSAWVMGESALAGIAWAVISYMTVRAGNALAGMSKLMFLGVVVFTGFWSLLVHFVGIHDAAGISFVGLLVRTAYGFFGGWLAVVIVLYLWQLFRSRNSREETEEEEDEQP
jgi:hypothetical protein